MQLEIFPLQSGQSYFPICEAPSKETRAVRLSIHSDPVGPSPMSHHRALQNPPIAVPTSGIPSPQSSTCDSDYLLVCEAYSTTLTDGRWRFTLEAADGELVLDAEDQDYGDLNRLTLLAAVRGLESLEGPTGVTLLSNNRYLIRSLSNSLPRWRQNNFMWEHFGRRIDVQHADLWRRVDRALAIHRVQACLISSCIVSQGISHPGKCDSQDEQSAPESSGSILRVDDAHTGSPPARKSRRTSETMGVSGDRLRSLLMGEKSESPEPAVPRRRGRFTAQDLRA